MTFVTQNCASVAFISLVMKLVLPEYVYLVVMSLISLLITFQESFNSRLKAEGDVTSTNLYVSNLPRDMTEAVSDSPYKIILSYAENCNRNLALSSWTTLSVLVEFFVTLRDRAEGLVSLGDFLLTYAL